MFTTAQCEKGTTAGQLESRTKGMQSQIQHVARRWIATIRTLSSTANHSNRAPGLAHAHPSTVLAGASYRITGQLTLWHKRTHSFNNVVEVGCGHGPKSQGP